MLNIMDAAEPSPMVPPPEIIQSTPPAQSPAQGEGKILDILNGPGTPEEILKKVVQAGISSSDKTPVPDQQPAPTEKDTPPDTESDVAKKIGAVLTDRYKDPNNPNAVLKEKVDHDFQLILTDVIKDKKGEITDSVDMQLETILTPEVWSTMTAQEKQSAQTAFGAQVILRQIDIRESQKNPAMTPKELQLLITKPWFLEAMQSTAKTDEAFKQKLIQIGINPNDIDTNPKSQKIIKKIFTTDTAFLIFSLSSMLLPMLAQDLEGGERKRQ